MKTLLLRILFLLAAEVIASVGVWSGTPTDWRGEPPHFWSFEVLRLQYWCLFGLSFTAVWVAEWMISRRCLLVRVLAVSGAACALGTEVLTSLYFWRRLPLNENAYFGGVDLRGYTEVHLALWVLVSLLGLGFWYLWNRRKGQRPAVPTAASRSL